MQICCLNGTNDTQLTLRQIEFAERPYESMPIFVAASMIWTGGSHIPVEFKSTSTEVLTDSSNDLVLVS
jgi:hypothetical protein